MHRVNAREWPPHAVIVLTVPHMRLSGMRQKEKLHLQLRYHHMLHQIQKYDLFFSCILRKFGKCRWIIRSSFSSEKTFSTWTHVKTLSDTAG